MSRKRYPEEFKIEAVKQVTGAGYSAYDVAERLGTTTNSLYSWIRRYRRKLLRTMGALTPSNVSGLQQ